VIAAAAVPVHLALALATDLSPDEAYYLCAARSGLRIVDHPPLTAWLLAVTDRWMPGPVELRVRIWAIVLSFVTSILFVTLAQARGAGREGAVLAAWVGTWSLLPMVGGFVTTPDTFLFPALALVFLASSRSRLLGGVAIAAAALSKVIALPIAAVLGAGAAVRRARGVALSLGLGVVAAMPFVLPSFRFQLRHAYLPRGGWSVGAALGSLAAAVGAQLGLWSPAVLVLGIRGARRALRESELAVVLGLSGLIVLSACIRAVPPEPNWWAPAALLVVVAFAAQTRLPAAGRRTVVATVLIPTVLAVGHVLHPFLPLDPTADPTARLHGWRGGDGSGHREPPQDAPGIGPYGAPAERCVYDKECDEIRSYFEQMHRLDKGGFFAP
jgi:hypothetical protein